MRIREFRSEIWLPGKLEQVFDFFSNAGNLDAITPGWVNFKIITPQPIPMRAGTLIDYRLRIRGFPVKWRTLISVWDPPRRFVDEQVFGPYRLWVHEHTFESRDNGTLVRDFVKYAVPFDWIAHPLFVKQDVERIFEFRQQSLLKMKWPQMP